MRRLTLIGKYLLTVFFFLITTILQASIDVRSYVDKEELSLQESLRYSLVIASTQQSSDIKVTLPDFSNEFAIISKSEQSQISIVNGKRSQEKTLIFTLQPYQLGKLTIPAAKIIFQGKSYQSAAHIIHVKQQKSAAAPSLTPNSNIKNKENYSIFAESKISKPSVYVGEQVIFEVNLFRRVRLYSNISISETNLSEFWTENLFLNNQDTPIQINDQLYYQQALIKQALFPLKAGNYTIESPEISFVLNPFNGQQSLKSKSLTLEVKALPKAGQPPNFSGLIGQFQLETSTLPTEAKVGQTLTIYINLQGEGNLHSINKINIEKNPFFKIYKSNHEDKLNKIDKISGQRRFEYIIIPQQAGTFKFPQFSIDCFSPSEEKYHTLKSPEIQINILGLPASTQKKEDLTPQQTNTSTPNKERSHPYPIKLVDFSKKYSIWQNQNALIILLLASLSCLLFLLKKAYPKVKRFINPHPSIKQQQQQLTKQCEDLLKEKDAHNQKIQQLFYDILNILSQDDSRSNNKKVILEKIKKIHSSEVYASIKECWTQLNLLQYAASKNNTNEKQNMLKLMLKCLKLLKK